MPAKTKAPPKKKAAASRAMVVVHTPNKPKSTQRVDAVAYAAMRNALLKVLPSKAPGLTQTEMWDALERAAPKRFFPGRSKVGWWMKTVQLDLETTGEVQREDTKPIRWHKVK